MVHFIAKTNEEIALVGEALDAALKTKGGLEALLADPKHLWGELQRRLVCYKRVSRQTGPAVLSRWDSANFIYFMYLPKARLIKMGTTHSVVSRMLGIKSASNSEPKVIGVRRGGYKDECNLRNLFLDHRVYGEVFKVRRQILSYVRENCVYDFDLLARLERGA